MKIAISTLMLLCMTATLQAAPAPTPTKLSVMGRVQWDGSAFTTGFPGATVRTRVTGTESIRMHAELLDGTEAWFRVRINGTEVGRIAVTHGLREYALANDLDPKREHALELVLLTEAWQGRVKVHGLSLDEGATSAAVGLPKRRILAIGDSITCGAAAGISPPYSREGNHNSLADVSFAYQLADHFHAQVHLVSYGGKGLIRDWQGLETEVSAPQFFERVLPDDPESVWDHGQYAPDLVTICLGTNDFNQGILPEKTYVRTYVDFCKRIFEVHPDTRILLLSSPMHEADDALRTTLEHYLIATVAALQSEGYSQVRLHRTGVYRGGGGNLDVHPNAQQHSEIAHELLPLVGEWTGWDEST